MSLLHYTFPEETIIYLNCLHDAGLLWTASSWYWLNTLGLEERGIHKMNVGKPNRTLFFLWFLGTSENMIHLLHFQGLTQNLFQAAGTFSAVLAGFCLCWCTGTATSSRVSLWGHSKCFWNPCCHELTVMLWNAVSAHGCCAVLHSVTCVSWAGLACSGKCVFQAGAEGWWQMWGWFLYFVRVLPWSPHKTRGKGLPHLPSGWGKVWAEVQSYGDTSLPC